MLARVRPAAAQIVISCEQCSWFFHKYWDEIYDQVGKHLKDLEASNPETIKAIVKGVCDKEETKVMPYGPDLCKFFSVDALDEVVCLLMGDHNIKSACTEMACNGKDPWMETCDSSDGQSCDDASGQCK